MAGLSVSAVPPRLRVLVVEDDARSARTLAQLLGEDGFEVEVVFDGAAAIGRLGQGPPLDALVVDFLLPHADGLTVATYARTRYPGIHVVFVTSYVEVLRQSERKLDPPATIMAKPLVYRDLTRELSSRPVPPV
jgi:CheY-like chemotaxis protein